MQPSGPLSARTGETDGRSWILRSLAQRLWLRRHVECRIRPGHTGVGAWRFGRPLICQRAVGAGDVSDLCVWVGRSEKYVAARDAEGRKARLLRIDGAGFWIESGWD